MSDYSAIADRLVFGLDIGTRSVVGSVGYLEKKKFNVLAFHVIEHDTRSMIDGQIHDIQKVGETISKVKRELEKQLELPLNEVCIAAAGRVLKTVTVHAEIDFEEATVVTPEHIHSLDLVGIENAYDAIRTKEDQKVFSPGVFGQIGGYPVIIGYKDDKISAWIDESVFSFDEMDKANRESLALDGVEDIRDATLIYTDDLISKVKKAFGEDLPKEVKYDEIEKTANFLIEKIITPQLNG